MRRLTSVMAIMATLCWITGAQAQNGRPPAGGAKWTPTPGSPIGQPVENSDANKALDAQLTGKVVYQVATWKNGDAPVQLPSPTTNLCLLTKVAGKFAGMGERIALYVDQGAVGGPRWTLNGTSGQGELMAEATCVSWTAFAKSPAVANQPMTAIGDAALASGPCKPNGRLAKSGRSAAFLSGIAGRFSGLGEYAKLDANQLGMATLQVQACSSGIDATTLTVTMPQPVKYRTLSGRTTNLKEATIGFTRDGPESDWTDYFPESWAGEDLSVPSETRFLLPADEAICGLTTIGGKLQGYGEVIALYRAPRNDGRSWWALQLSSQAKDSAVTGSVRCLARDQR